MIQSWENVVTDGQTDRQTDKSDFIGRYPTNVENKNKTRSVNKNLFCSKIVI